MPQRVESHQALPWRGELLPLSFEQRLQEPLSPACALLDELAKGGRRLLARDIAVVINDADTLTQAADADADVGVFRQILLIPATHALEHLACEEDRVAAQWGHAQPGVIVQATLEPEKVFQHVEGRVPVRLVVHELYPTLDDRDMLAQYHGVNHVEDVRVDIVLRIENSHYLVAASAQSHVETVRLVDRRILEGYHTYSINSLAAQLRDLLLSLSDRAGIIGRADHQHLQQRHGIAGAHYPLDSRLDDILFVPCWQHHGEGLLGL